MKKLLFLFSIGAALIFTQTADGQKKWTTYENARFGYSIAYPSDLFVPQEEADNGDGRVFLNNAAEIRVFASNVVLHETLESEFKALLKERKKVSYKLLRKNFFVVSGVKDGRIFYQKTIARADDVFLTFYIEYAEDEHAVFDRIVAKIAASFK